MTTTSNSLDTQKEVHLKSINIAYSALNTSPPKQFNGFSVHNLHDGVLFSCYLNAAALTRAVHRTRLRWAGRDVWTGAIPVAVSTCDEILTGWLTGWIAPIYSCQLDGTDGDAVGKF